MHPRLTVAALGGLFLVIGGACAQTAPVPGHVRQPRPIVAPSAVAPSSAAETPSIDLDATRKRFDKNSAKQAEADRKRDAKLNQSMRSICAGCDGARTSKPARAAKPRTGAASDDVTSPED